MPVRDRCGTDSARTGLSLAGRADRHRYPRPRQL